MSLSNAGLGGRPRGELRDGDVVDDDLHAVPFPPRPGVLVVEPSVEVGDEMGYLGDAELLRRGAAPGVVRRPDLGRCLAAARARGATGAGGGADGTGSR